MAQLIRAELTDLLRTKVRDHRIDTKNICIDDVRVSVDLAFATVYVSSIDVDTEDQKQDIIQVLTHARGFLRRELAKRMQMRTTPELQFEFDQVREHAYRIEALIEEANARDAGGY